MGSADSVTRLHQDAAKAVDLEFCRRNGIDVVRRITGGKLVLHHLEITYSIASSDAGDVHPRLWPAPTS